MNDEARHKRLLMRASRRGTKEMDLVLGRFAKDRLAHMDTQALDAFEALLSLNDHDLYAWISGTMAPPAPHQELIGEITRHFQAQHGI